MVCLIIWLLHNEVTDRVYYTALLIAVECTVHLHGPSRLPVNYFQIITVAKHIMTAVKDFLPLFLC